MTTDRAADAASRALDELVRQHMPLVGHLVREAMNRVPAHVNRDDLTSAGLAALVVAAKAYDAERGVNFSRYASTRVRGAIIDELRGMDWASRSVRRRARSVDEARGTLATQLGRTPSDAELATALGLSIDELAAHHDDISRASVLSLQGFDDTAIDDLLPSRAPASDELLLHRERVAYLRDAVDTLPERLRVVVEGYFFAERPMAEIADELGVTESRVSQMRAEAMVLLKDGLNSVLDPDMVVPHTRPDGCAARRREAYFAEVAAHRSFSARLEQPAQETRIA